MRGNQSGSVVSFAVIGVVLAMAAVGVFYYAGQQFTGTETAGEVPEISLPPSDTAPESGDRQAESGDSDEASQPQSPQSNDGDDKIADTSDTSDQSNSESAEVALAPAELSQSGPSETLATMIAVGSLAAACAGYVRSRGL